jgi:hypothetical protein
MAGTNFKSIFKNSMRGTNVRVLKIKGYRFIVYLFFKTGYVWIDLSSEAKSKQLFL